MYWALERWARERCLLPGGACWPRHMPPPLTSLPGLGWVYALTKYEPVLKAANGLYGVWAKFR